MDRGPRPAGRGQHPVLRRLRHAPRRESEAAPRAPSPAITPARSWSATPSAYDAQPTPAIDAIVDTDLAERVIARRLSVRGGGRRPVRDWVPLLTPLIHHDGKQLQGAGAASLLLLPHPRARVDVVGRRRHRGRVLLDGLRGVRFPDVALQEIRRRVAQRLGGEEQAAAADTIRRMGDRLEALREMRINREAGGG